MSPIVMANSINSMPPNYDEATMVDDSKPPGYDVAVQLSEPVNTAVSISMDTTTTTTAAATTATNLSESTKPNAN